MADRSNPSRVSVTIRRLVLPEGAAGPELGEAIAAALTRELAGEAAAGRTSPSHPVAQDIARGIARHPGLAAAGVGALSGRSDSPPSGGEI